MTTRATLPASLVLALVACGSPRDLAFGLEDSGAYWFADDHGHADDFQATRQCANLDTAADLELEWCARVSPESEAQDFLEPPIAGADPDPGQAAGAERCGFFNMVQGAALEGTVDQPLMTWCDPDLKGGVRAAWYDGQANQLQTRLLVDQPCIGLPRGVDLLPRDDGTFDAAWLSWDDSEDLLVGRVGVSGDGVALGEPVEIEGGRGFVGTDLVPIGAEGGLLLASEDASVHLAPFAGASLADDTVIDGGVVAWGSHRVGDDLYVAFCDGDSVELEVVDPVTYARGLVAKVATDCLAATRISMSGDGDSLALAWHGVEGGHLWFLRGEDPVALVDLEEDAWSPEVRWHEGGYLSVDTTGQVRWWTAEGLQLAAWSHPNLLSRLEGRAGIVAFRMATDGEDLVMAVVGEQIYSSGDHQYKFQNLELSRVKLPAGGLALP